MYDIFPKSCKAQGWLELKNDKILTILWRQKLLLFGNFVQEKNHVNNKSGLRTTDVSGKCR